MSEKSNVTVPGCMADVWETPCPFCGALPLVGRTEIDDPLYEVKCTCCGVEPRSGLYNTLEEACAAWVTKVEMFNMFCARMGYSPINLLSDDGQAFAHTIFAALPDIMGTIAAAICAARNADK